VRAALLHGLAGDPAAWDDTIAALAVGGPIAPRAVALPGHGGGPVRATWRDNLAATAAAVGEVDLVVGYSLGARVALGLLAEGLAPRAILVSVRPGLPDAERAARRASDAAWAELLRAQGLAAFLAAWEAQPLFATQAKVATARREARRARRLALDADQVARSLETMGLAEMPDYRAAVAGARCALVAGADDPAYAAIARAAGRPYAILPACGHDPTLERPGALAAAIAALAPATDAAPPAHA
jgi:2-succinyl-6-hydroxy-2,4-cyclohexadiene-1-carboxylate synthase